MSDLASGGGWCVVVAALLDLTPLPVDPFEGQFFARWSGFGALALGSLFLSVATFQGLNLRHPWAIPVVACVAGVVALAVMPVEGALSFAWVPLVVNAGCVVALARRERGKGGR